jgi:hypothetical protein
MELVRVKKVKPLNDFVVHVWFTNGTERDIDLEKYLHGPIFEEIRSNPETFRTLHVGEGKTLSWDDGADIDPDTLYHDLTPAWAEEFQLERVR